MTADLDALAQAHMRQQVRETAALQTLLARLWDQTMDPNDIDGSFERFQPKASALIKAGRARGEVTAQRYFDAASLRAGYAERARTTAMQPAATRANRAALHATSVAKAKASIARGVSPDQAMVQAKAAMLRSAKRRILEAPRSRLITLSDADKNVEGWARVSDGRPCYFCAMLVSRGPVYSEMSGGFEAHDGCGCSVAPVFKSDSAGGWSPDARALRELYESTDEENGQRGSYDWRATYSRAIANPKSAVSQAVGGQMRLAA